LKVYFDTGLLVKLYLTEQNSLEATALIHSYGTPICFCGLQQTELRNALYRKCGRREITERQLAMALKDIQADMDGGVLQMPDIEWPEVWTNADRLTAKYALATQCRTLDVLHVAVVMQLDIKTFGTTDVRQMVIARKAGLKVVSLA
jgi:predicted nucleic acid-binding protein